MKLKTYLEQNKITFKDFAELGNWSDYTVYHWIAEDKSYHRRPSAKNIKKIAELTNGQVTANDFYN